MDAPVRSDNDVNIVIPSDDAVNQTSYSGDVGTTAKYNPTSEENGGYDTIISKNTEENCGYDTIISKNTPSTDVTSERTSDDEDAILTSASSSSSSEAEVKIEQLEMGRSLGFISSVSMIVGTIVGSGIFISPKGVLESTGSPALSLVVWIGAGIIALLGGLCYAELGTLIGKSGGEYAYIQAAMGNALAFLFTWISIVVIRTSSLAIMTLTMAEYVATFFSACGDAEAAKKMIAVIACLTVGIVNSYSTNMAARVQVITTALKVAALIVILLGGIYNLCIGKHESLDAGFTGSTDSPSIIALAFYDALWAYDGWQNLNYVTEEVKDPAKTLPRANIAAVLLVIVLYAFTNVSYLTMMTTTELLDADAVAVLWGDRMLKSVGIIIPLCVIISTFGSSNGTAFTGSRTIFAAGRDGNLPEVLSYIHVNQRTPQPSMVFTITIAIAMIAAGNIFSLIDFFSFTAWLFYGLTFLCLLVLRYTMRDVPRPYKVPIPIPIIMFLIAVYLVVAPIVEDPQIEFLYAFLFVLAGLLFYIPFVFFKLQIPGFDYFTVFVQLVMEVSPTADYKEIKGD